MSDILRRIAADKRLEVEELKISRPLETFKNKMPAQEAHQIRRALSSIDDVHIIAEIKKGSPSKGILVEDFDVSRIATEYVSGGAAALSVLTERKHFFGRPEYMAVAKKAASLPILCKDFILDPYQIYYARYMQADAILLIVGLLALNQLKEYRAIASELGLDCLVEVHDEEELQVAIDSGAEIMGVNNRNLNDFSVSLEVSERLSTLIPNDIIKVAESGLFKREDITRLQAVGYNSFLIGEALVTADNPSTLIQDLCGVTK